MTKPLERMTRAELIGEIRRIQAGGGADSLRRTIYELQVYREEVRQQNEELIGAQRQLEWTLNRYTELYDSAPVGYVTLDDDGVIQEINLTGARMLEREPSSLMGTPFLFVVVDSDRFTSHLAQCRTAEADVVTELSLKVGKSRSLAVEIRSRRAYEFGRSFFRTTITDLTERRRAEAERQELAIRERVAREANSAKDQFLSILSHELRNPLAAISAGVHVLAVDHRLPPQLTETVARIRRNVASEARLIADLLDASRIRHGKVRLQRRPVDLHAVLADSIAGLRAEYPDLDVCAQLEAEEHIVKGDVTRLGQVVSNLLRNAREATSLSGSIRVLTWNPIPSRIVLAVVDTGHGIHPDALASMFKPFEQHARHEHGMGEGLGLGLAISKGLIEAHGGELTARSAGVGKGARFDIDLPTLIEPYPAALSPDEVSDQSVPESLRILLVDDHQDTVESLAMLMEEHGYQVLVADSIRSALERAEQGFDVLVSDLGLPDGSGRDLARQLAEKGPLRAIALSGYGADSDIVASREAGFRAHLVKPVEPARLFKVIARVAAA